MEFTDKYDILFGLEAGSIICWKKQNARRRHIVFKPKEDPSENSSVSTMSWGRNDNEVLVGYANGTWRYLDVHKGTFEKAPSLGTARGVVIGLIPFEQSIIVTTKNGLSHVMANNVYTPFIECDIQAFMNNNQSIEKVVCNPHCKNIMGLGGNNYDLRLFDIENKKPYFIAKSDPNDNLNLQKQVFVSGITFFDNLQNINVGTVTRQGQIRLYDTRVQRRAVKVFKMERAAFTSITATNQEYQVVTGGTTGMMQVIDIRNTAKPIKSIKGYMGGVVNVYNDLKNPILLSCSLDRFFEVHNLETFNIIYQEYLKSSISCMLIRPAINDISSTNDDVVARPPTKKQKK